MLAEEILERKGRSVATIGPGATIREAVSALKEHNVGALIVSTTGDSADGIISERDIVRCLADDGPEMLLQRVDVLMKSPVFTCAGTDHVDALMNVMTANRFRHLPVVDDDKLVGIISIGDVVKCRVDELETTTEQLVDYIRTGR